MIPVSYHLGPNSSGSPEFSDFFQKILLNKKMESEFRGKVIDFQPSIEGLIKISHGIGKGESQFVFHLPPGMPHVAAANG